MVEYRYSRQPIQLERANSTGSRDLPAYLEISYVNLMSRPAKRLMLVLRTSGCIYARGATPCTMCGFRFHSDPLVTDADLRSQIDYAISLLKVHPDIAQVDVLTLGSFYDDREISANFRSYALGRLVQIPHIRKVVVESRASHITREILAHTREVVSGKILEVGVGVESSNNRIRNDILHKGLSWNQLERVVRNLSYENLNFQPYLLIKPQTLSEREAIEDAIQSATDVSYLGRKFGVATRIAFEPVFVPPDTDLDVLYRSGKYRLLNLWSIIEVIKRSHGLSTIFVGMSDEGLASGRVPNSCPLCADTLRNAIQAYNAEQDLTVFRDLKCECQSTWRALLKDD